MKLLIYAGGEYLTGDDIALALVDYSQALASVGTAESVEIPIREKDGSAGTAVFLVGPSSQIVAKSTHGDGQDELVDDAVVERLRARMRRLRPPPTEPGRMIDWDMDAL